MRAPTLAALPLALAGTLLAADAPRPKAVARPVNADDVRRHLGLAPEYANAPGVGAIKVAVLDHGFDGVDGQRPYLPADAVVVEHYDPAWVRKHALGDPDFRKPFAPGNSHGRMMAQLVWATTGNQPDGPKFLLLNANGPTLFRRAVRYAVEQRVDVILFSGTFEGAGNYDGRGPVNAAVDEAVNAGVLWVNAAGNVGRAVYNGPVEVMPDGFVRFRGAADPTALRIANRYDENTLTVTLTWNDYRDDEDAGTDKDLDLIVEDGTGREVGRSTLWQVPPGGAAGDGKSKNPRERVVLADLPASAAGREYRVRVRAGSANFGPTDRLRVMVTAARDAGFPDPTTGRQVPGVELLGASGWGEIYPPADHPGVLTVGDTGRASAVGPTADGRVKPDVVLDRSSARFSDGQETAGSSNAAAYFAGVLAVMKAAEPALTAAHVRDWVRRLDRVRDQTALGGTGVRSSPVGVRQGEDAGTVTAYRPPSPPAPAAVPLSPNQERAMRYAEQAAEQQRRMGVNPRVVVSTPIGTFQFGRTGVRPPPPPPVIPSAPPPPPAPVVIPSAVRAQLPSDDAPSTRREPHAAWRTPSRAALAALTQLR